MNVVQISFLHKMKDFTSTTTTNLKNGGKFGNTMIQTGCREQWSHMMILHAVFKDNWENEHFGVTRMSLCCIKRPLHNQYNIQTVFMLIFHCNWKSSCYSTLKKIWSSQRFSYSCKLFHTVLQAKGMTMITFNTHNYTHENP